MKLSAIDKFTNLKFSSVLIKKFLLSEIQTKQYKLKDDLFISLCNSQIIITKIIDILISYVINEASLNISKSKLGLYDMHYEDIENAIYKNKELKMNFLNVLLSYDNKIHYGVIEDKQLLSFLDMINLNIKVNKDALNFIQYLINYICCEFLRISFNVMKEMHKIRINSSIIKICFNIMFIGDFNKRLIKELEDMIGLIDKYKEINKEETKNDKDKNEEEKQINDEDEKDNEDDDNEEEINNDENKKVSL